MRLSEAIMLGDSLKKCDAGTYLSREGGQLSGCALGGALLAVGVTEKEWRRSKITALQSRWPWLTDMQRMRVGEMYALVHLGEKTIEDVAAYVRTIEPPEPEQHTGSLLSDLEQVVENVMERTK